MKLMEKLEWKWDDDINETLFEIRKHLHQYPELSFQEEETSEYICSWLNKWNISYRKICSTGVVVDICGEKGDGLHLAIRADIDALPIKEETGLSYSSSKIGIMHACGHDGHTTILLSVIYHLHKLKKNFSGRIRCIFQPGEEADGAAKKLIEANVLENPKVDAAIALHLWPKLPLGTIGVKKGTITAACDDLYIDVIGKGGHSARPHLAIDAISISANLIQSLQYLQSKWNNPVEPIILHIGKISGGEAGNIVANKVHMEGTVRVLSPNVRKKLKEKLISHISNLVSQYGATSEIKYVDGHPPVVNDEQLVEVLKHTVYKQLGEKSFYVLDTPSLGADDFGYFSEKVPSVYFRLGIKEEGNPCYDLHHPKFNFNEQVIPIGGKVLTQFALDFLKGGEMK